MKKKNLYRDTPFKGTVGAEGVVRDLTRYGEPSVGDTIIFTEDGWSFAGADGRGPPNYQLKPSQSGSTGTLVVEVQDTYGTFLNYVRFKTHDGTGNFDFSDPTTGWTTDSSSPYSQTVSLSPKHNSTIACAIPWDDNGTTRWVIDTHTFDFDYDAEFTQLTIGFDDAGHVLLTWKGDEDFYRGYVNVGIGTTPSVPTAISKDGTLSGRYGTQEFATKIADLGEDVYCIAVPENFSGVVNTAGRIDVKRRRGDTQYDEPSFRIYATRSGTTITVWIVGTDLSASMTAWSFSYKVPNGSGGYHSATNSTAWTSSSWSAGAKSFTSTKTVTCEAGVTGWFSIKATYTDNLGASKEKGHQIALENIDSVSKSVRFSATQFVHEKGDQTWLIIYDLNHTNNSTELFTAMCFLSPGSVLTNIEARMFRSTTSEAAILYIRDVNQSGSPNSTLATLTTTGTGSYGNYSSTLNHTVGDNVLVLTFLSTGTASGVGKLLWVELTYDVDSYDVTV